MDHLQSPNAKTLARYTLENLADEISGDTIGFNNCQGFFHHRALLSYRTWATVWPISAGLATTCSPHCFIVSIFSAAVPLPPSIIAPAWPMRRPGGAVCPAMKPTTGFLIYCLI